MTSATGKRAASSTPGAKRRAWSRTRRLGRLAMWATLVTAVASFGARLIGLDRGVVAYLVAIVPWVTFALAIVLAGALVARKWVPAGAAGALALLGLAWMAPLATAESGPDQHVLVVASMNLKLGSADAHTVVTTLRERDVDIIAFQELTPELDAALRASGIDELMPYSEVHSGPVAVGSALWSRYPLSDGALVPGLSYNAVRASVDTPAGAITAFSVHPPPPLPQTARRWNEGNADVLTVLDGMTGPVLAAGDFNATRDHMLFRRYEQRGFLDAADQAGAGFLPTFPVGLLPFPVVAIDHVIVRDAPLHAVSVDTVTIPGTDHRALIVGYATNVG